MIDKEIVSMEFDNKNFEKNVKTSLSTLDRLKLGLSNLSSTGEGIAGFASTVKAITFDPINNQVQIGIGKVMALTAALTGVVNISNELYNLTTRTIKSLTVDQISSGWSKYEQKITGIQVIMNAVKKEGEAEEQTLARIEPYMDKLAWFTDETSYNLSDMVDNIGRFTAAGVDLDDAVTAMIGIATWGAKATGNTTAAAGAMMELSQSLGRGYVMLKDWQSIMTKHMDSEEFKKTIIESGLALGTLKKEGDKVVTTNGKLEVSVSNFTSALNKGWMSTEVLMDTLKKYGEYTNIVNEMQENGETASKTIRRLREEGVNIGHELGEAAFQAAMEAKTLTEAIEATKVAVASKFSDIFEIVFGNFIEARDLWTSMSETLWDMFAGPLDIIKELFIAWKEAGGRVKIFEALAKVWDTLSSVMDKVKESWGFVFGSLEDKGYILDAITDEVERFADAFEKFSNTIIDNETVWSGLESTFNAILHTFKLLKNGIEVFHKRILSPFIFNALPVVIEKISDIIYIISTLANEIVLLGIQYDIFNKIVDKGYEIFDKVKAKLLEVKEAIMKTLNFGGDVKNFSFIDKLKQWVLEFVDSDKPLEHIKNTFSKIIDAIGKGLNYISPILYSIWGFLKTAFSWIFVMLKNIGPAVMTAFNFIKNGLDKLNDILKNFIEVTKSSDKNAFELIADLIATGIKYLMDSLKDVDLDRLNGWLDAIQKILGIVIEILTIYIFINEEWLTVSEMFNPLAAMFQGINDALFYIGKMQKAKGKAALIKNIATALLMIAGAMLIIAMIPADRLNDTVNAMILITIAFGAITAALYELIKAVDNHKMFTEINKGGLIDNFAAQMLGLATLVAAIGVSIMMLSASLYLISKIDWKDSLEGLIAIGGLMGGLIGMAFSLKNIENPAILLGVAATMILISIAIGIIALAVAKLSKTENSIDGLVAVTDLLATFIGLFYALKGITIDNIKPMLAAASAMILIGVAINLITIAIKRMGKMDSDKMVYATGMVSAIMGYMVILVAVAGALNSNTSAILAVAGSLVIISLALLTIAKVVENITSINNPELVTKTLLQLGAIATALIGFVAVLMTLSKQLMVKGTSIIDKDKLIALASVAIVLNSVVAPIVAISGALTTLAKSGVSNGDLLEAAGSIGVVIAAIGGLLAFGSTLKGSSIGGIFAIAGAFTLLAAAIRILTPAVEALSRIDWANLTGPIIAFGVAMAALYSLILNINVVANALPILSQFATQILKIGAGVALIGTGALMASLAIFELVKAFRTLVDMGPEGVETIVKMIDVSLGANIPKLMQTINDGFDLLVESFLKNKAKINVLTEKVIETLMTAIRNSVPSILSTLRVILTALEPFIYDVNEFLYNVVTDLNDYILDMLNEDVPKLNEHLEKATADLFERILRLLHKYVPLLNEELEYEGENLIYWINRLLIYLTDTIIQGTITILTKIRDNIGEIVALLVEIGTVGIIGLLTGLIMNIPLFYEKGVEFVTEFLNLMNTIMETNWDDVLDTLEELANKTADAAEKWVDKECEVGGRIYRIVSVLFKGLFKVAIRQATNSPFTPIGLGKWIATQITDGLEEGVNSKKTWNLGKGSASNFIKGFRDESQINSPSKVMEKLGGYLTEGLGIGLDKGKEKLGKITSDIGGIIFGNFKEQFGSPTDILSNLGGGIFSGLKNEFQNGIDFGSLLGDYTNLNPTITPTLDLSVMQSQSKDMENMFSFNQAKAINVSGVFNTPNMGLDAVSTNEQMKSLMEKMNKYMDVQAYNAENKQNVTNVNVTLEGDAKKMLKVMKVEDSKQSKATGLNAFGY